MSGEGVLTPAAAVAGAAVGVAAVAIGGSAAVLMGVGKIVQKIVDDRVEAAKKKVEAEKGRIREWQAFQEKQSQEMNRLKKIQASIEESEKQLRTIRLTGGKIMSTRNGPTAQGYTSLSQTKETHNLVRSQMERINKILENLPDEFTKTENSPYIKLVKHKHNIENKLDSGTSFTIEEINTFKEMIFRTLTSYINDLDMERQTGIQLRKKAEILFDEILISMEMAVEKNHMEELNTIKCKLLEIIGSNNLRCSQLELLEKKFAGIKGEIDLMVIRTAIGETAADSVTKNLLDMGYEPQEYFTRKAGGRMMTAMMRIPGGEFVRVAIHKNNQLSFQVTHAARPGDTSMSEEELIFFRQQEKRWCRDFQELVRRLTREGFSYSIGLDRLIPNDSIPIVIFESADDIDQEENNRAIGLHDEPKKRRLT
jgi:hypothetical protein